MRKPRLSRTLKRWVEFRPIEDEDIRYLWAAYKKNTFDGYVKKDLTAKEFKIEITELMLNSYSGVYVCLANTKQGFVPVGVIPVAGIYLGWMIGDVRWFPWASTRNIIESFVNFINEMKKEVYLLGYCSDKDKDFFVYMAKHGIIRRVGSINPKDKHLKLFESR